MVSMLTWKILGLPRFVKRGTAVFVDVVLCIVTVALAFYLRLGTWTFPAGYQWLAYLVTLPIALPLFITSGLYRAIFRYIGWSALVTVARACALYGLVYACIFTLVGVPGVPRTIGIIQPLLLLLAVGASRAFARHWLSGGFSRLISHDQARRVLIYGAGSAGRQLAAGLANSDEVQIVGFADDNSALHGSLLHGKPIHKPENLAELVESLDIDDVLLAMPSVSRQRRNEIVETLLGSSATIRTLPGLSDLAHGRVTVNDLRELQIEDLLGRDAVPPNQILLGKCIVGKTVLVTGAGGSIGGELCRQILALRPERLILVEMSEYNLYAIHQELEQKMESDGPAIVPLLGSVQDRERMTSIIAGWRPETIYHAAAYKHVPLVEHNPVEGVRNNVFGTLVVAGLAQEHGVQDFVLISTDKAVRPTNIMGATKRIAENILQALAAENPGTRFSMVRFGNVLGSSGSVVPLFRKQIAAGGPITVTHEEITRYFMTIPEAAQLVIQAGAMAQGGEVFVLDMGEPVRIVDLARRMIELSGLTVRDEANSGGEIEIRVVGLRPGEKLYEELLIGNNPVPTSHPQIMKANESHCPLAELTQILADLDRDVGAMEFEDLRAILLSLVPEFAPENAMALRA